MEQYRFNDIFVSKNKKLLEKYVVELDFSAYRRYFDIWVQIEETQILIQSLQNKIEEWYISW